MERKYTKAEAGRLGARRRWGDTPRVVRLDDLTPPERRLVVALVDAARAEFREPSPEAAKAIHELSPGGHDSAPGSEQEFR